MPTPLRVLLPALATAALAATGCSGSGGDPCSELQTFATKNAACLNTSSGNVTTTSLLPSQATCSSAVSTHCTAADKTTLGNWASCLNSQAACTGAAGAGGWWLTVGIACDSNIQSLSLACQSALGLGTQNNTSGGSSSNGGNNGGSSSSGGNNGGSSSSGGNNGGSSSSGGNNGGSSSSGGNNGGSSSSGGTYGGSSSSGGNNGGSSSGGSSGGVAGLGTPCTIDPSTQQPGGTGDSCETQYNLACGNLAPPSSGTAYTGTCQLPVEYETCQPASPGCATTPVAYDCISGLAPSPICFQPCTSPTSCASVTDTCVRFTPDGGADCYFNFCGPGSGATGAPGTPDNGALYGGCTVVSGSDGYCTPYMFKTQSGNETLGLCTQTGAATTGSACTVDRPAAGGNFCTSGDLCFGTSATSDQGSCEPVCAAVATPAADAGTPSCGGACLPIVGDWGFCLNTCSPGSSCATGTSCQGPAGFSDGGSGDVCVP